MLILLNRNHATSHYQIAAYLPQHEAEPPGGRLEAAHVQAGFEATEGPTVNRPR